MSTLLCLAKYMKLCKHGYGDIFLALMCLNKLENYRVVLKWADANTINIVLENPKVLV